MLIPYEASIHCGLAFSTLAAKTCFLFQFPDRLHLFFFVVVVVVVALNVIANRLNNSLHWLAPPVCQTGDLFLLFSALLTVPSSPVALSANERALCLFHTALGWLAVGAYAGQMLRSPCSGQTQAHHRGSLILFPLPIKPLVSFLFLCLLFFFFPH